MIYTGVGSRRTPPDIYIQMVEIGAELARRGWHLRSGGADGADLAFEAGCIAAGGPKTIFLPRKGYNERSGDDYLYDLKNDHDAEKIAAGIHPAWDNCSPMAKRFHTRNIYQVLGADLIEPSDALICWTEGGKDIGGTRTAIVCARRNGVPVFNMGQYPSSTAGMAIEWVDSLGSRP